MMKIDAKGILSKAANVLKERKYVLIVLLVGLVLILLPRHGGGTAEESVGEDIEEQETETDIEALESRLEGILSMVDGAGEVRVMLARQSDGERVIAKDTRTTDSEESESAVIVSTGSGTDGPVELRYIYPEFRGAIVVAEGADRASVKLAITEAVAAITGLGSDSIKVVKMK